MSDADDRDRDRISGRAGAQEAPAPGSAEELRRDASEDPAVRGAYERMATDVERRLRAEVDEVRRRGFSSSGSAMATVCVLKGELSAGEREGEALLAGADGDALRASFQRLGYDDGEWAALSTVVSGAGEGRTGAWSPAAPEALAWAIEVVDPEVVIAEDEAAERALCAAWGQRPDWLASHEVRWLAGRRALSLGGFEGALDDVPSKRVMWNRLKLVPPLGEPA